MLNTEGEEGAHALVEASPATTARKPARPRYTCRAVPPGEARSSSRLHAPLSRSGPPPLLVRPRPSSPPPRTESSRGAALLGSTRPSCSGPPPAPVPPPPRPTPAHAPKAHTQQLSSAPRAPLMQRTAAPAARPSRPPSSEPTLTHAHALGEAQAPAAPPVRQARAALLASRMLCVCLARRTRRWSGGGAARGHLQASHTLINLCDPRLRAPRPRGRRRR